MTILEIIEDIAKQCKRTRKRVLWNHAKQTGSVLDQCRTYLASQVGKADTNKPECRKALDAIHKLDCSIGNDTVEALEALEAGLTDDLRTLADTIRGTIAEIRL